MSQEAQTADSQKLTPTVAPWIGILSRVGAVSAIVGAWLLLAGWSYLYFYFFEFGIGISSLQIDNRILPLWGLIAAASLWWQLIALGTLVFVAAVASVRLNLSTDLIVGLTALLLVSFFALGFYVGKTKAIRDIQYFSALGWPNFQRAIVYLNPSRTADDLDLARIGENIADKCHRVIYFDNATIYLFRPLAGKSGLGVPVTVLDRGDVTAFVLGPSGLPLCQS